MPKIYFTYGTSNLQPYCGGWTEITAPTENQAAIDTNNHPEAPEFIESNNLGHATGRTIKSGFCEYPVYEFDMNRLPPIQY